MKICMESVHISIWQAVVTDYKVPITIENGKEIEKPFESWDQRKVRRAENDAKALNIIHSALNSDEFFRISAYTTAKVAWDLIKVTHEGTPEVRRARKSTLIQEYETFGMTQGESIMDMQKRFTNIINHLKELGKAFVEEKVNVKVLKSLNRRCRKKAKFPELNVQKSKSRPSPSKALKVTESSDESSDETLDDSDEISFLSRRIHSILRKKGGSRWRKFNRMPKDKTQKQKSLMVTWEDLDLSSSEEEIDKEENICLMAGDDITSCLKNESNEEKR
ncbi:hypothetical protein Fmac_008324 [Flemingia macrophylla]|uniref:UBN2 domain-containing protein n=1 Tax=Flemingia macrophylla TaxID=520843 RepID=A0ABD1MX30_9FABA